MPQLCRNLASVGKLQHIYLQYNVHLQHIPSFKLTGNCFQLYVQKKELLKREISQTPKQTRKTSIDKDKLKRELTEKEENYLYTVQKVRILLTFIFPYILYYLDFQRYKHGLIQVGKS